MSVEKLKELESTPVGRLLWKYSVPAVVGTLVMSTYNIIDRVFIGQGVGAEAIAGLAVTFPVMNISAALGTLIGVGAASRISIALGEKNHRLAEQILGNSLVLTVIIGILYISAIGLFLKDILLAFGANELTLPYAYDYMSVLLPGLLIINICYSFNNMMRTSGYPQKAMITMILGAVLNVTLDPIFIFYLDLGIKGASIATVISMTISAAFVMTHFINPNSILHFKRGTFAIDKAIFISIIGIGAAPFLVNVSGSAINAIVNQTLLRHGGYFAVGAVGIFSTYVQLIIMIIIGICQGVQPIIRRRALRSPQARFLARCDCGNRHLLCRVCGGRTFPGIYRTRFHYRRATHRRNHQWSASQSLGFLNRGIPHCCDSAVPVDWQSRRIDIPRTCAPGVVYHPAAAHPPALLATRRSMALLPACRCVRQCLHRLSRNPPVQEIQSG